MTEFAADGDAAEDGGAGVDDDVVFDDGWRGMPLRGCPGVEGKDLAPRVTPGRGGPGAMTAVSPMTTPVPWSMKKRRRWRRRVDIDA